MVRSWVVTRAALAAIFVVGAAADSRAQAPDASGATEPIRLDFDAPAACGTADDFFDALRARTDRVRRSEGYAEDRRFSIRITATVSEFDGRLSVTDPGDASPGAASTMEGAERRISAASCAEVVQALAIVAALAIDANASQTAHADGPEGAAPGQPAPVVPAAPASASAAAEAPPPAPQPKPPPSSETQTSAAVPDPLRLSWFLGVQAGVELAEPRSIAFPTGALTGDVALERGTLLSPSLRAALSSSLDATVSSASGRASFALTTLRLEPCPVRVRLSGVFGLVPCAVFDAGLVSAAGEGVNHHQSRLRPWIAAGAAERLFVALAARWRLDIEAGVVAAISRDTFQFLPDETVYEFSGPIPFVAAGVSFGWPARAQ